MKRFLFISCLALLLFACKKRSTYNCKVVYHTNIGGGVDLVFDKTIKATHEEMLEYEQENTDSTKTTTCH